MCLLIPRSDSMAAANAVILEKKGADSIQKVRSTKPDQLLIWPVHSFRCNYIKGKDWIVPHGTKVLLYGFTVHLKSYIRSYAEITIHRHKLNSGTSEVYDNSGQLSITVTDKNRYDHCPNELICHAGDTLKLDTGIYDIHYEDTFSVCLRFLE